MDIISLPIEHKNEKIDSRFRLVNIAIQRAKDLSLGSEPKISAKLKALTTIAIEETIQNVLEFLTGEDAIKAKEEAKKFTFSKFETKRQESDIEELSELERDLKLYMNERESSEDPQKTDASFNSKK